MRNTALLPKNTESPHPCRAPRRSSLLYCFPVLYQILPSFLIVSKSLYVNELFGSLLNVMESHVVHKFTF